MSRPTDGNSRTYEDIVRQTVVDPDSSVRPTRAQEQQAREGFRALDADEQALHDRVHEALSRAGFAGVTVEVSRELVTLRGQLPDVARLRALEEAVARLPGVETIHNQVVVAAP
jgi:hypothetical protein